MGVALQVAAGGVINADMADKVAVRLDDVSTAVAASATVNLPNITLDAVDEAFMVVMTTDATAGQLTLTLEHDEDDTLTFVAVEDGLYVGGERAINGPSTSLVLDMSVAENQNTIIIGVVGTARQVDSVTGVLIQQLRVPFRLVATTDGSWNGTAVDLVGISGHKAHNPGPKPGA